MPPGESVWDYPRPPRIEPTPRRVRVVFGGVTIVDTRRAWRLLETSHPPTYYVPIDELPSGVLSPSTGGGSFCEWKGMASYFDVTGGERRAPRAAWTYVTPAPPYEALRNHVAFYAASMDACYVDDERVTPQPGGFYGGWITSDLVGPFKGVPGSAGW
jgi:uncharacterized protein (DUF427 family)